MSRGLNKAMIIGNVGQDPEMRYTANEQAVVNVSIATSESWRDKQTGDMQDRVEWHRVVMYGKLAEIVGKYVKKGTKHILGFKSEHVNGLIIQVRSVTPLKLLQVKCKC